MLAERYETNRMLDIKEVRDYLGLSYNELIRLVRIKRLKAYKYAGDGPMTIGEVSHQTRGLRFRESDVEDMLERSRIK